MSGENLEEHVLRLRTGHGANCSSIGSVVDTLFATAAVGAAVLAAIVAALRSESVEYVEQNASEDRADSSGPIDPPA